MSSDLGPARQDQDRPDLRIGAVKLVGVRAVSFDVVADRFHAASGSPTSWTFRNLVRANQAFGGWIHGRIPVEEIPAIVLPFHVGGCDRHSELPQKIHLVPPSGLTIGDAHARLSAMRSTYRRLAPFCYERITGASEQALSGLGTFFFSAEPMLIGSTYGSLTAFQGRMTHLDGLHRLLGLMDAEQKPHFIEAFVAVETTALESWNLPVSDRGATTMASPMPMPASLRRQSGSLVLDRGLAVHARFGEDARLAPAIHHLVDRIDREIGMSLPWVPTESAEAADLVVAMDDPSSDAEFEDESYTLTIGTDRIHLRAPGPVGAMRGLATLTQLATPDGSGMRLPLVEIDDSPRFAWRGLVLDSVRRWLPPEVIRRNLEAMAAVKLNVLHWHLTDDQGFRIESRRYPLLHELGSGGSFYSHDEIREIVGFATDLGIRVVPEFDMPGHTASWFVGYPELASAPGPYRLADSYGGQSATMDPSRSEVYEFISGFLEEMTSLFPDPFVHIGGDEVDPTDWKRSRTIGAFMQSEGIDDFRALQAHFNRRLHDILSGLDRQLVGWDPVLHESLPRNSVVETVRGQEWLVESARRGHRVIAGSDYYLTGMRSAGYHYRRDPLDVDDGALAPSERDAVLGGEASMWTEVAGPDNIDSRIWPRAAAVAERLWSPRDIDDVDDMYLRLSDVSDRLDRLGVTHVSGPRAMREQLLAPEHHADLHALSDLLRPVPSSERKASRTYTTSTALNRLVDATAPESWVVRRFERLVTAFCADTSDPSIRSELTTVLSDWKAVGERLQPVMATSDMLAEAAPLAAALSFAARIGLDALETRDVPGCEAVDDTRAATLESVGAPAAELRLAVLPGIARLLGGV